MHIVKCMVLRNIGNAPQKHVSDIKSISDYNYHMVSHEGKEFLCKELDCGYIRNIPHQLADYMVKHKGVKYPFCGEVFYHRQKLAHHKKKEHADLLNQERVKYLLNQKCEVVFIFKQMTNTQKEFDGYTS